MPREIRIGTMGFSYADWLGAFYPRGTKSSDYLATYASRFGLVELDTTWHAMPDPPRVTRWAEAVPATFRFTAKVPRAITHDRPLLDGLADMREFVRVMRLMGDKLGALLLQFPPTFAIEHRSALMQFLDAQPKDIRFAVEFRHESWFRTGTIAMLEERNVAWVAGAYEAAPRPITSTADFAYVRLIGRHGQFEKHDRTQADLFEQMKFWRDQIESLGRGVKHVFLTINNDYAGHSPATAAQLSELLHVPLGAEPISAGTLFK